MLRTHWTKKFGWKAIVAATAMTTSMLMGMQSASADARTVTITSLYGADKPASLIWNKFGELVEEQLPGQFNFKIITDAALGGEKEEAEGIMLGSINGSLSTIANLTSWVPEGQVFDMPFMFRDQAHIDAVMASSVGEDMKALYKAQGFTVLGYVTYGSRVVMAKRPIASVADIEGKTMRVLPGELHVELWSFLGANPTAIPITEAYNALETGIVDLMDMTRSGYENLKLYEVAPEVTSTDHIWSIGVLYFGNNFFDSLTEEQQAVFTEVAPEATAYFNELIAAEDAESLGAALEHGAEVVSTDLDEWRAAMQPFWESYGENIPGGIERINQIVAVE